MMTHTIIRPLPLIAAALLAAPAALAVQTDCYDREAEYGWQKLLAKYPGDYDLRNLYQLRHTLCRQVENNTLPLDAASKRFEEARQRLIQKWRKQNERRQAPRAAAG